MGWKLEIQQPKDEELYTCTLHDLLPMYAMIVVVCICTLHDLLPMYAMIVVECICTLHHLLPMYVMIVVVCICTLHHLRHDCSDYSWFCCFHGMQFSFGKTDQAYSFNSHTGKKKEINWRGGRKETSRKVDAIGRREENTGRGKEETVTKGMYWVMDSL